MADPRTHTTKIAPEDKPVLSNQFTAALFHLLDLTQQKQESIPTGFPLKRSPLKLRILKRLSPFLLTALFLPVLCVYWLITGDDISKWLLCALFVITEINLFYIDIVLWKYFEGKKIARIWMIEVSVGLVTAYFVA
ncbi:MAG TPA: hypothetical protein VH396_19225 [Chitinophagaceae bacterium]